MDIELFLIVTAISLILFVCTLFENNIIVNAMKYNIIANKVKKNMLGIIKPNTEYRLPVNSIGSYIYDPVLVGENKFGCYKTDNKGNIEILQCGNGTGCFFLSGSESGSIDNNSFCTIANNYILSSYKCDSLYDFGLPSSSCTTAYLQNK